MEQSGLEQAALSKRRLREKSSRAASKWLSGLKGFDHDSMTDINDCLTHMEQLDSDEKSVSGRITDSDEFNGWLQNKRSCFLIVDLQTPQNELNNPLSFTSAVLAITLRSTQRYPVLSYFCMDRNNEFPDDMISGPLGMIKSLDGQLLEFMNKYRPDSNVALLKREEFYIKSKEKLKHGVSLLQALISLLPEGDTVFIILDCLSCLSGDEERGHKLMIALNDIIKSQKRISIRVLVTDPSADSPLRKIAKRQLHLLDTASGGDTIDFDDTTQRIRKGLADGHHADDVDREDASKNSGHTEDQSDSSSGDDDEEGSGSSRDDENEDEEDEDEDNSDDSDE